MKYYEKKSPESGIYSVYPLHDSVPAHRSQSARSFMEKENVYVLPYSPYPSVLSLCAFFLFPILKKHLSGRRYAYRNALGSAIYKMNTIPQNIIWMHSKLG